MKLIRNILFILLCVVTPLSHIFITFIDFENKIGLVFIIIGYLKMLHYIFTTPTNLISDINNSIKNLTTRQKTDLKNLGIVLLFSFDLFLLYCLHINFFKSDKVILFPISFLFIQGVLLMIQGVEENITGIVSYVDINLVKNNDSELNHILEYEDALKLNQLGFCGLTTYIYNREKALRLNTVSLPKDKTKSAMLTVNNGRIPAPSYEMAFQFFRDNHIDNWISKEKTSYSFHAIGYVNIGNETKPLNAYGYGIDTHQKAKKDLLKMLLALKKTF